MTPQEFLEENGWKKDDKGMFDFNGLSKIINEAIRWQFMQDNGLSEEDMINDITLPHEL